MAPTAKPLGITTTPIPGFLRIDLTVHGDNRGWFKENWQREKMVALGLPDFQPVQNNISFNDEVGVTRGIHAEPWDKFVSGAGPACQDDAFHVASASWRVLVWVAHH